MIVLGDELWRSTFAARADVIGERVTVDGASTETVGVLPALDFPGGSRSYWVPLVIDPSTVNRGNQTLDITGRLASGVSQHQAAEALNAVARTLGERYPATNSGMAIDVVSLKQQLNGDAPRIVTLLAGAILAVLLIACSNVASLLAVRASVRSSELALRAAIGGSLRRLRRQLLVEHLVLAGMGAALALAIAVPINALLVERRLLALPQTVSPSLGWAAFVTLLVLVVLISAVLARITARRQAGVDTAATLLTLSRYTSSRRQLRLGQALVVFEVAGALALVVVAGLMLRSASQLAAVIPGFRTDGVLTFGVVLPPAAYPEPASRVQFVDRVLERVRVLPGVQSAASAAYGPMGGMRATRRYTRGDRPLPASGSEPLAVDTPAGPDYFQVMGIPVIDGRLFTAADRADAPPVIVVSETFAREVFPGERAIGKPIRFFASQPGAPPPPTREVAGVVVHQLLRAYCRGPGPIRPHPYAAAEMVGGSFARQRAMTWLLVVLAIGALTLAAIGLYGVSATAVTARSRELAIRAAVGAEPRALRRLMLRQGVRTGVVGVAIGSAVALASTRGLGSLLYESAPHDPLTFAGTAALLLAVATATTYLPARRALRRNPADVLRAE